MNSKPMEIPMKSFALLLVLAITAALPAIADETPEQIVTQLQAAYDQNTKAMDDGNIDDFMMLFADDYVGKIPPDGQFDKEQVRELVLTEIKQSRRAHYIYTVENVEFVDGEGGKRETVATVLQTIVNEAVDRQGQKVKKTLKVRFKDSVVKTGASWQIKLREPQ